MVAAEQWKPGQANVNSWMFMWATATKPCWHSIIWLVYRDPDIGLLWSLYNWVGCHPLYTRNNQGFFHCSCWVHCCAWLLLAQRSFADSCWSSCNCTASGAILSEPEKLQLITCYFNNSIPKEVIRFITTGQYSYQQRRMIMEPQAK